jgi:hypothetical protein
MVSWRVAMMQHIASLDLSDNPMLGAVQGLQEGGAVLPPYSQLQRVSFAVDA